MSSAAGAAGQPLDSGPPLASETAVAAPEQLTRPSPGRSHRGAERLRSFVLMPRGGGTRRRASDAVRLGLAVMLVAVSVPLIRANTSIEIAGSGTLSCRTSRVMAMATTPSDKASRRSTPGRSSPEACRGGIGGHRHLASQITGSRPAIPA
jgi:hypothetical protein